MNTGNKIIASDLLVNKQDLKDIRFQHNDILHHGPLADNELLVKVDQFAFTSNNITYAAVGDTMQYWDFFPAEKGWGRVPCWGFAEVIASNSAIEAGERIYGYFPMSTHLRLVAGRVNKNGFYDIADHRKRLPIVYNHYIRTKSDPAYKPEYEGLHSLFQPLFATSFLLDDYMADNALFGAEHLVLTSASSKTAIALAYLLKSNQKDRDTKYTVTGLTSPRNIDFVRGLGIYDAVQAYDSNNFEAGKPAVIVDFAGNKKLLLEIQNKIGDDLTRIIMVGLSHWEDRSAEGRLHVENEFFFAPSQAEKRTSEWGGSGLRDKMAASYIPFLQFTGRWLKVRNSTGLESVEKVYMDMVAGNVNPAEGWVLSLHGDHV